MCILTLKSTTAMGKYMQFYITYRELEVAYEERNNYQLYILFCPERVAKRLFIIKDIPTTLGLEESIEKLLFKHNSKSCHMKSQQYIANILSSIVEKYEDKKFAEYIATIKK